MIGHSKLTIFYRFIDNLVSALHKNEHTLIIR